MIPILEKMPINLKSETWRKKERLNNRDLHKQGKDNKSYTNNSQLVGRSIPGSRVARFNVISNMYDKSETILSKSKSKAIRGGADKLAKRFRMAKNLE